MTYPISNVPLANNNPSNDQPTMLTNFQNISSYLGINHVAPGTATQDGQHFKVDFFSPSYIAPVSPTENNSLLYPQAGIATTSSANLWFQNSTATPFLLNLVRAFGTCSGRTTDGPATLNSQFNVTSVTRGHGGGINYAVSLPANVVTGTSYGVLVSSTVVSSGQAPLSYYAITSATSFVLQFNSSAGLGDPVLFTFIVLQV